MEELKFIRKLDGLFDLNCVRNLSHAELEAIAGNASTLVERRRLQGEFEVLRKASFN